MLYQEHITECNVLLVLSIVLSIIYAPGFINLIYRLLLVRIDSMCFINSIYRLLLVRMDGLDSREKGEFRGRLDRLYSSNEVVS